MPRKGSYIYGDWGTFREAQEQSRHGPTTRTPTACKITTGASVEFTITSIENELTIFTII